MSELNFNSPIFRCVQERNASRRLRSTGGISRLRRRGRHRRRRHRRQPPTRLNQWDRSAAAPQTADIRSRLEQGAGRGSRGQSGPRGGHHLCRAHHHRALVPCRLSLLLQGEAAAQGVPQVQERHGLAFSAGLLPRKSAEGEIIAAVDDPRAGVVGADQLAACLQRLQAALLGSLYSAQSCHSGCCSEGRSSSSSAFLCRAGDGPGPARPRRAGTTAPHATLLLSLLQSRTVNRVL